MPVLVWAAIAKHHKLGGSEQSKSPSYSSGGWNPKIGVQAWSQFQVADGKLLIVSSHGREKGRKRSCNPYMRLLPQGLNPKLPPKVSTS